MLGNANGDSYPDLLSLAASGGEGSLFFGSGDGTFTPGTVAEARAGSRFVDWDGKASLGHYGLRLPATVPPGAYSLHLVNNHGLTTCPTPLVVKPES